jgi:hypothetical protein
MRDESGGEHQPAQPTPGQPTPAEPPAISDDDWIEIQKRGILPGKSDEPYQSGE